MPEQPQLFPLGKLVITCGAQEALEDIDVEIALMRHQRGDWGVMDDEDKAVNNRALSEGSRLLSAYQSLSGIDFWIITEWDRSITTILLPREY